MSCWLRLWYIKKEKRLPEDTPKYKNDEFGEIITKTQLGPSSLFSSLHRKAPAVQYGISESFCPMLHLAGMVHASLWGSNALGVQTFCGSLLLSTELDITLPPTTMLAKRLFWLLLSLSHWPKISHKCWEKTLRSKSLPHSYDPCPHSQHSVPI